MAIGTSGVASFGPWYRSVVVLRERVVPTVAKDPDAARAARNAALGGAAAGLLGLVGVVIAGWMASGEPMTLTYYRAGDRRPA
jgi:hypothetical protein